MPIRRFGSAQSVLVRAAFYATAALGLLDFIAIPWHAGGLARAPLYFLAARGIRRERAWSAYGLALFTTAYCAASLISPAIHSSFALTTLVLNATVNIGLGALLISAGRAMQPMNREQGPAWIWIAATILTCAFMLPFDVFDVSTSSMENTLLVGDQIAVRRGRSYPLARGEIIVFVVPAMKDDVYVKRVVGVPGDRLRIIRKRLIVNDRFQVEPYARFGTTYIEKYRDDFPADADDILPPSAIEMLTSNVTSGEVVVPDRSYFVLGDNRDFSDDSRYWGFVRQSDIIGRVCFVYFSVDPKETADSLGILPIARVRWTRMFHSFLRALPVHFFGRPALIIPRNRIWAELANIAGQNPVLTARSRSRELCGPSVTGEIETLREAVLRVEKRQLETAL